MHTQPPARTMSDVKGRDALGLMHNVRQYRHSEPSIASEAVHSVPREENVHMNRHTRILVRPRGQSMHDGCSFLLPLFLQVPQWCPQINVSPPNRFHRATMKMILIFRTQRA
jgi:hypothetical protein